MLIDDRIGFACTFLSDTDLVEYICQLTDHVYEKGDISGILLTGRISYFLFQDLRAFNSIRRPMIYRIFDFSSRRL